MNDVRDTGWAAGTPRDEDEARAMLREVEPAVVQRLRARHREMRRRDAVSFEYDERISPRHRAAVTRDAWGSQWRAEPVPALTTRRARCEASGARVVLAMGDGPFGTGERYAVECDEPGVQLARIRERVLFVECAGETGSLPTNARIDGVLRTPPEAPTHEAAGPYGVPRGWCALLSPEAPEAR